MIGNCKEENWLGKINDFLNQEIKISSCHFVLDRLDCEVKILIFTTAFLWGLLSKKKSEDQ